MKKPLIINIRGNSGSGKTHLTREFMKLLLHIGSNVQGDNLYKYGSQKWVVLGRYSNTCGGCDTIKTQQEVIDRVDLAVSFGYNVWLEGLIMSTIYGSVGAYSEKFEDRWVFAYLDTPIETCIKRIKQRRKAAGNEKPLNETNTRNRVRTIERNAAIVAGHGRRVVVLPHQNPLQLLMKIIRKEGL